MTQPTALWLADWLDVRACGGDNWNAKMNAAAAELRRLHAQRKPLTREEAIALWADKSDGPSNGEIVSYCRAIEAAHGIKEGT